MPVVVVTGAGSGIGAAVAQRAARDGWTVVATGRRSAPLEALAAEHPSVHAVAADMADEHAVTAVVDAALADHGRLDAVVANAGIMRVGSAAETEPSDWDDVLRTNLRAPYLLARAALPALREASGCVVAIGSIAGLRASAGASAYAVSKAALSMLVRTIAVDEGPHGVRANVVHPGWVRTEMGDQEMAEFGAEHGLDVEAAYAEVTSLVPARRAASADEIAGTVAWLLGPDATYVNGAEIVVDGGTVQVDAGTVPFAVRVVPRS